MQVLKMILMLLILVLCRDVDAQKVETIVFDSGKNFEAINWLDNGKIYIADYQNGRLYEIGLDGGIRTLVTEFANIAGGGIDNEGDFYFSGISNGTVNKLNGEGGFSQVTSGINQPVAILPVQGENQILVSSYGSNAVYKVELADGSKTILAQNQGINGPDGMVKFDEEHFLVANFNNNRIHKVSNSGEVELFAQLPISGFAGYIANYQDEFYIPSIAGRKIFFVDRNGMVTEFAGSGAQGNDDGNLEQATFTTPNGIAINSTGDTILVSDGSRVRMITEFREVSGVGEKVFASFGVGPNPCVGELTVKHEGSIRLDHFEIYNTSGNLMMSDTVNSVGTFTINVEHLDAGTFVLVLSNMDRKLSKAVQFVKVE